MTTLTLSTQRVQNDTCQSQKPMWMVLHGANEAKRYRWSDWAKETADALVRTGEWVVWQTGNQVEVKHRSRLEN